MAEAGLARFLDRFTIEYVRTYAHPIARVWRAVVLVRRVKMATGRIPIAGRAITEFVNVETVFAWC